MLSFDLRRPVNRFCNSNASHSLDWERADLRIQGKNTSFRAKNRGLLELGQTTNYARMVAHHSVLPPCVQNVSNHLTRWIHTLSWKVRGAAGGLYPGVPGGQLIAETETSRYATVIPNSY